MELVLKMGGTGVVGVAFWEMEMGWPSLLFVRAREWISIAQTTAMLTSLAR